MTTKLESLAAKGRLTKAAIMAAVGEQQVSDFFAAGITDPRQMLFHLQNPDTAIPKCFCGTPLAWNADSRKYRSFCSNKCTEIGTRQQRVATNQAKFGKDWFTQTPEWKSRTIETNLKKYGTEFFSQTEEHTQKTTQANQRRFGVDYPAQSQDVINVMKTTCATKYGVTNPAQYHACQEKQKQTSIAKYGVDNPNQKHYSNEAIKFLSDDDVFTTEVMTVPITALATKYGISTNPIYAKVHRLGIQLPKRQTSSFEAEVRMFVEGLSESVSNDRSILGNKQEIDIYIPEKKLAVECNGTYWHSEVQGKGQKYHLEKTLRCEAQGVQLLHIWEHDWNNKKEIIQSIIKHKLGKIQHRIFARCTSITELTPASANEFFKNNHLQGACSGNRTNVGLLHNGTLVAAMSFGKSRFDKKTEWELLRFAVKTNTIVIGGASKLFTWFLRTVSPSSVVSYANRMYSSGALYRSLGMRLKHISRPGYKYTKDFTTCYDRQHFQKHKLAKLLPIFDQNLSEADNMKINGYTRIWDCGQFAFVWGEHE